MKSHTFRIETGKLNKKKGPIKQRWENSQETRISHLKLPLIYVHRVVFSVFIPHNFLFYFILCILLFFILLCNRQITQIVEISLEPLQSAAHNNIFIAVMKYRDEIKHSQLNGSYKLNWNEKEEEVKSVELLNFMIMMSE